MSIFVKHIELSDKLNVSVLSNRATARVLFKKEIKNTLYPQIRIDFKNIEFASRSFLDELNYLMANKKLINIQKVNMNEQVLRMEKLVTESRKTGNQNFSPKKSESTLITI